MFGIDNG